MSRLSFLIEKCKTLGRISAAIVDADSEVAISGAIESYEHGILDPILIGPKAEIKQIALEKKLDISTIKIIDVEDEVAAAVKAAQMASKGEVHCLVKGSLHTDVMMHQILQPEYALHTQNLISACGLLDVPGYKRLIFITDMVMNIAPSLEQKAQIINNAVGMARSLGWNTPKVAILSAVEVVNYKMQATLDAAILSKMADREQISNCIVDGPIDLDIAISPESAQIKHFKSAIMGDADILILPDLQAANMLYKALVFMSGAIAADVILGARIPIVITSRSDNKETRLYSVAAAALIAHSNLGHE